MLPLRPPKLNGNVERAQRTHQKKFYYVVDVPDTIAQLQEGLRAQEAAHNSIHPYHALRQRTSWESYQRMARGTVTKAINVRNVRDVLDEYKSLTAPSCSL